MVNAKICKKCGADEMVPKKSASCRLGYLWACKACRRENDRKYRKQNPERCKEQQRKYYEQNRERYKVYARQYSKQNPECYREASRKYRKKNPEATRAAFRKWAMKNQDLRRATEAKRRALKRGVVNTLTTTEWKEIQQRFDHRCAYCGERKKLSLDHVTPLNDFGGHTANNIVPACISCNSKKYTGPPPVPVQTLLFA